MIIYILMCTLIGWLCGHALIGLAVGLLFTVVIALADR